jgi:hypothetical protein
MREEERETAQRLSACRWGRMQVDIFWARCESEGLLEMPVYAGHRDGGSHAVLLAFYKYGVDDYWRQPNAPSMCLGLASFSALVELMSTEPSQPC